MEYRYRILVNSRTAYQTDNAVDAFTAYAKLCRGLVIVVQLIDNRDYSTILEYRP